MWKPRRLIKFCFSVLLVVALLFYGWPLPRLAHASPGTRVRTVEFFGGQLVDNDGIGENVQRDLAVQSFSLSESSVDIIDAYVEISAQIGMTTATTYASSFIYFDADSGTPTPVAYTSTADLGNNSGESQAIRFRANVISESDIAAYTGGGTAKNFQISYCFATTGSCTGTATVNIQAVNAKLVITYTYDDTSSTQTNTVVYPLESASETGSKTASQASCTMDSNCPTFSYNAVIPEISSQLSQWFYLQTGADVLRFGTWSPASDIGGNPGGDDSVGVYFNDVLSNNGGWYDWLLSGVDGYANNSSQSLEISTNATAITVLGGENYITYTYANSAATKTKTVVFPAGELITSNADSAKSVLTGSTVYFPETGVDVQKAWFRVHASRNATSGSAGSLAVTAKVGSNSETATTTYSIAADTEVFSSDGYFVHLIPSTEYSELEAATASSGKTVQAAAQWTANAGGAVSAELVITYTYTSDAYGYLVTQNLFAGQQTAAPATSYTTSTGAINPKIAETVGTRTIRGVSLRMSAKNTGTTANEDVGANLTTSTCTASNTSTAQTDTELTRVMLWKNVTGTVTTNDATTYTACYSSGEASVFSGVLIITYQWDNHPIINIGTNGAQTTNVNVNSANNYIGNFTAIRTAGSTNGTITAITVKETGTINANTNLANLDIYYEAGCGGYSGLESLFGTTASFNGSEQATVSGTLSGISTSEICLYAIVDVGSGASGGQTIEFEITNPYTGVTLSSGGVTPTTTVAIAGTTTVNESTPVLTFSISDNSIGFGTLSSSAARYATGDGAGDVSEAGAHDVVVGTNAANGYTLTATGTTLTSGANTITAIGSSNTASSAGSEQFGIRATATGGSGAVSAPYAASGFAFDTAAFPDEVAAASGTSVDTVYSVRYLANISPTTEAGAYAATVTYVVTGTF